MTEWHGGPGYPQPKPFDETLNEAGMTENGRYDPRDANYYYMNAPFPVEADTFLKTLRESLVQFDQRLTDLEQLGGLIHASLKEVEKRLDDLEARHDPEHFLAPPLPWWARSRDIG